MVDLRQSPAYAKYITSLGWVVENGIFIRKLGIFGAIAKIQRTAIPPNWREIIKKHHVWMTKWEPEKNFNLQFTVFKQDSWPLLATKTLQIDLTPSSEKILAGFKKDARYCLRKISNNQYSIINNDFDGFYKLWKKSAGIKKLWTPPLKDFQSLVSSFGKSCFCITIDNLAGALILIHDQTAYYYYAGALPEGKKKNLQYLVVWKCMLEAKKRGCKFWDFEGIYDPRWPNKDWKGFSHFKKSFGGTEIDFPGSFTKWGWW